MSWKRDVLREIDARLDLPQPARSRVILEIAADLEDTSHMLMERGLSPEEAREQAIRRFEPRGEALSEITTVHAAGLQRFLGRFSGAGRRRWERALLLLLFLFLLLGTRVLLPAPDLFKNAGPGLLAVVTVTVGALLLSSFKLYDVFVRPRQDSRRMRRGLDWILGLAGVEVFVGLSAFWLGLYGVAGRSAEDPATSLLYLFEWLVEGTATAILALQAAVLLSLLWYLLSRRTETVARFEAEALMAAD
ncbi:MAG: permease prefix domain 1-containing protein [marine benthic group bacterium]|nr:permease prefix domain 1-containing protein [Gemmatimonadota bacterium]